MKRLYIPPPNPFGIHFLKASLILVLFFIHGEAWINQYSGHATFVKETWLWKIVIFFGTFNVFVPCTAGAMLRLDSKARYQGLRLEKFDWSPILWLAFALALVESAKAALMLGLELFFAWDVLHLVAISMIVTLALARISILAVWGSIILCLLLTPFMRDFVLPFQARTFEQAGELNALKLQGWFLFILCEFAFAFLAIRLWHARVLAPRYKFRLGLLLTVIFALSSYFSFRYEAPPYFSARIINLPAGILAGDQLGLHYWPFFPWYTEVAFGYGLYDFLIRFPGRLSWKAPYFLATIIAEIYFFQHDFAEVIREYDPTYGFSTAMYRGSMSLLYLCLIMFSGLAVMWEAVARSRRARDFFMHHPRLFQIPYMLSRTILLSYVFINTIGILLAIPFAKWLPYPIAIFTYPLFAIFIWLFVGQKLMDFLSTRRIVLKLKSI